MREMDLLRAYFYNREIQIENELQQLRERIRFRPIGVEDCVELMLTEQRRADFLEFRNDVLQLLHL